jgi:hypothetical protein
MAWKTRPNAEKLQKNALRVHQKQRFCALVLNIYQVMRTFLLFMLCLFTGLSAHAQQYFTALDAQQFSLPEGGNQHVMMARLPEKIWALDRSALQAKLATAPWENSKAAQQKTCVIAFPLADGRTKEFAVEEIAMLDAGLAAQFPEIHTYAGKSVDGSGIGLRFSVTYRGFRAMVLHPDMNVEYIEPVAWEVPDQSYFIAYDRRSLPAEARAQAAPSVTEALQSEKSARYAPEWEGYKGQALAGNQAPRALGGHGIFQHGQHVFRAGRAAPPAADALHGVGHLYQSRY